VNISSWSGVDVEKFPNVIGEDKCETSRARRDESFEWGQDR
jgi:hypothetical protein